MTSRRYRDAAIRVAAVRGVLLALPHATDSEIARALGMSRDSVLRHRSGRTKADPANMPAWAPTFLDACAILVRFGEKGAADAFENLAKTLREIAAEK
jgi:hypothetical protein